MARSIFCVTFTCATPKGKEGKVIVKVQANDEKGALRAALLEAGGGARSGGTSFDAYNNKILGVTIEALEASQGGVLEIVEEKPKRTPRAPKADAPEATPEG